MQTAYLYNIVPFGFTLLLIYMFIDISLDYFKNQKKSYLRRIILYTFIFYLLSLIQIKTGGFNLFPNSTPNVDVFFITNKIWFGVYELIQLEVSRGYMAVIYNLLLFVPLGFYILTIFDVQSIKKMFTITALGFVCFIIIYSLLYSFDIIIDSLNILDCIYLLFNFAGAMLGFFIAQSAKRFSILKI